MLTEYELQLAQQIMSLNPGMTPEQAIAEVKGMPPGAQAGQYAGQQGRAQAELNRQAQQQRSPLEIQTGQMFQDQIQNPDKYNVGARMRANQEVAQAAQAQAPQPCPTCGGTGVVGKSTNVNDSWPELNIKY
jgi:DnaJ-class molecular chaperone